MVLFTYFFRHTSRVQMPEMHVAVTVLLTAIVGILAGLDQPTAPPLELEPVAMRAEQQLLAE
jgi:hypothetical protein